MAVSSSLPGRHSSAFTEHEAAWSPLLVILKVIMTQITLPPPAAENIAPFIQFIAIKELSWITHAKSTIKKSLRRKHVLRKATPANLKKTEIVVFLGCDKVWSCRWIQKFGKNFFRVKEYLHGRSDPQDGSRIYPRNVHIHLKYDTMLQFRRPQI